MVTPGERMRHARVLLILLLSVTLVCLPAAHAAPAGVPRAVAAPTGVLPPPYVDFDQTCIPDDEKEQVKGNEECWKAQGTGKVRVEGNCDERRQGE